MKGTTNYPKHALRYIEEHCGLKQAKRAGMVYLTAPETKKLVGLPKDKEPSDGLGIKLSGGVWSVRFLRDGARPKFKQTHGTTNVLYEAPGCDWKAVRSDTDVELLIVEGWIKALAMPAPAIGVNGTYGWMSDGAPLADFENFEWAGRTVRICFDSDLTQKPEVRQALARLAKHLRKLKARVFIRVVPPGPTGEKVGPDDYVREHGIKAFRKLKSFPPSAPQFFDWNAPLFIQELNQCLGFLMHQGQAVILRTEPDPQYPGTFRMSLSRSHAIEQLYRNDCLIIEAAAKGEKAVKVHKFLAWMASPFRRAIRQILLNPTLPPGYDPKTQDFNLWQGWAVVPHEPDAEHSWSLLKKHILRVVADGNKAYADYIVRTLAFWVQHPDQLPEVAPVFQGGEGAGKGKVWKTVLLLFGRHGIHLSSSRQLVGAFNKHLEDKLFVFADEAVFAGDPSTVGVLFAMITEPTMAIEQKYVDIYTLPNFRKFGMATNSNWSVPAALDARRFAMFKVSESHKQDHAYFAAIDKELDNGGLEAMLWELQHMELGSFDPRKIPRTRALFEQKRYSFDETTRWWFSCLLDGKLPCDEKKWSGMIETDRVQKSVEAITTNPYAKHNLDTQIGVQLRKLCPAMRKQRIMLNPKFDEDRKRRAMHYVFPSLAECRTAFESVVQQTIDWETGDANG